MPQIIGVDVGGTFTDLVWRDEESGRILVGKQPTSPGEPEQGVLDAVAATLEPELVASTGVFMHGTTVGLNALIERRGATVALLCTEGFRDVLEVRRGDRDDPYDLFWSPPPAFVPRRLRFPLHERVLADGSIRTTLDTAEIAEALAGFLEQSVDAIAVALINAYANPAHELAVESELRRLGFEGDISLSHRASGEYREYERTCTTVIDAFVRRRMGPYLSRLNEGLTERGFTGDALITRSGGGAMTFVQAAERPFETVMSGPAAGAMATARLAQELGLTEAIGADVGGTSFDTCLVERGRVPVLYQGTVVGLPLQAPWVDVRSIGAGGGSVARIDAGGLLRVGPESAGALPGPACYDRGGTQATVTDAAVVLGMLPESLAGGVTLSRELAETALEPIRQGLGFDDLSAVARGILQIALAGMADAIRGITVERGRDPREAALVAFGGAGPLFATQLAQELGMRTTVIPSLAGNFSAWGLLAADLSQTLSRTRILRLGDDGIAEVSTVAAELFSELDAETTGAPGERELHLDLRYRGQEHSLTIAAPYVDGRVAGGAEALRDTFTAEYSRTFGITLDEELEIVTIRASTRARRTRAATRIAESRGGHGTRQAPAWSLRRGAEVSFALVDRATLASGDTVDGPAIIQEPTTTTYLDAGYTATVHETGALILTEAVA